MRSYLQWGLVCLTAVLATSGAFANGQDDPLDVYIRAQEATHGPEAHDYPAFLEQWTELLRDRGIEVDGSLDFPSPERLAEADVMIMYCQTSVENDEQRRLMERFVDRGGDLVVLHSAVTSYDAEWLSEIVGGAWVQDQSQWSVNEKQGVYFQDLQHPITRGVSNFDLPNEEVYWDLDLQEDIEVLANSYHDIRIIEPQMWTYEGENHRSFVWLSGHRHGSFDRPHTRALVLRGLAWAAGREADTYLSEEELGALKYPKGGPVRPADADTTIQVHPEFDLSLVSAEPDLVNPIDFAFDARGRIWVAETPEYPQVRDEDDPKDRISILEDTDGDGRVDEKRVFYEGLSLVTSLALYEDGVLVAQAPHIYRLRDTDGDGEADEREIVLTGFGTDDTHAVVNHLRWSMDGWVYATLGYSRAQIVNADGKEFGEFTEGVFRFRPDGSAVQKISSRGGNTWGVGFTWDGELLWSQATSGRHLFHTVVPEWAMNRGRLGETWTYSVPLDEYVTLHPAMRDERPPYVQVAPTGGFTAGIGATPYTGGTWPEPFASSVFVSEPTLWLTHRDVLERAGATYSARVGRPETEFVGATDLWFCPVGHRVGPDGALYLLDFYNQAVSHNDIRLDREMHGPNNQAIRPDRARRFGRLWRIDHQDAEPWARPSLHEAGAEQLVEALAHPNRWQRITAQRLLVEGGHPEAAGTLRDVLTSSDQPARARVHALWTLEHLDLLSDESLARAIREGPSAVRRNGLRVINNRHFAGEELGPAVRQAALSQLESEAPRVRVEALIALGSMDADVPTIERVVGRYPDLDDDWARSAALGVLNQRPEVALRRMLEAGDTEAYREIASAVVRRFGEDEGTEEVEALVAELRRHSGGSSSLMDGVLEELEGGDSDEE